MLYHLEDADGDDDLPAWELVEAGPPGRTVNGLFEDLMTLDPSGAEAADLR